MSQLRFFVKTTEVFPKTAGANVFDYKRREHAEVLFDITVNNEIVFDSKNSGFNFKTQESVHVSEELDFTIQKRCGNVWAIYWQGAFSVAEGSFDDDQCTFSIKPRQREYIFVDTIVNVLDSREANVANSFGNISTRGSNPSSGTVRSYGPVVRLQTALEFIAVKSSPKITGVISNFFQFNPTGPFPLAGITNFYDNFVLVPLSGVQEPPPSNNATEEYITFGEIMDDLNSLFDVFWFIDSNYKLRIEHRSFFDGSLGLDLTIPRYSDAIKASTKYNYDLKDYPKQEIWKSSEGDQQCTLTYDFLGRINKNTNYVTIQPKKLHTDYTAIRYDGNNSTSDGFFLFAVTKAPGGGFCVMIESRGQNAVLTPHEIVKNLFKYNRPYFNSLFYSYTNMYPPAPNSVLNSGAANAAPAINSFRRGGSFYANSIKPTKQQVELFIPFCCGDTFNVEDQIKTQMGFGFVDSASVDKKTDTLKLVLKYKVPNNEFIYPTAIAGLRLWLRGDQGVTVVSGKVTQWTDFSGNNLHAVPSSAPTAPVYNPTNKWLEFTGNEFLRTPAFQLFPNQRGTIFFVYQITASGQSHILSTRISGAAGTYWDVYDLSGTQLWSQEDGSSFPTDFATSGNGLVCLIRDANQRVSVFQDGMTVIAGSHVSLNTQPSSKILNIGPNNFILPPIGTLKLSEVIIYDRNLTEDERQRVEYYFAQKGNYLIYP